MSSSCTPASMTHSAAVPSALLHHTRAVVLKRHRKSNEGLRRVWWYCCKYENVDPVDATRLPLLFALDSKLDISRWLCLSPGLQRTTEERQRVGALRR